MTYRQSHAASHRNSTYKVQPVLLQGRKAITVQLDWTSAPIVKTTIRRDFKLFVVARDTQTWQPVQRGTMMLKAGQTVYFVQSDDHPGYYYITVLGESCTCTAGLYKQHCHHQDDAASFEARRQVKVVATVATPDRLYRILEDPALPEEGFMVQQYAKGWRSILVDPDLGERSARLYSFISVEAAEAWIASQSPSLEPLAA